VEHPPEKGYEIGGGGKKHFKTYLAAGEQSVKNLRAFKWILKIIFIIIIFIIISLLAVESAHE
jgi:hypothetical protein